MTKCRKNENFHDVVIYPIDQSMFFGDSPGIDVPVISLQLFNLTGPRSGVLADFFQKSGQFRNGHRCFPMQLLQILLRIIGKDNSVHLILR